MFKKIFSGRLSLGPRFDTLSDTPNALPSGAGKSAGKTNGGRAMAFLTALAVAFMWSAFNAPSVRAEQVVICSAEDFKSFANDCVLDSYSKGKTFSLECDIVLNEDISVPVFCGVFEGNGHSVSGLRISSDGSEKGLFRYIEEGGVVKDLRVGGNVVPSGSGMRCGGIAGVNRGRIIDCSFSGLVSGKKCCGGIAGINEESGFIADCSVTGAVRCRTAAGGIAGENNGMIICCVNEAAVNTVITDEGILPESIDPDYLYSDKSLTDITDTGGIAGYSAGSVQNCINRGSVGYPHVGYNTGGVTGRQQGYTAGCANYGEVLGRKDVGGIAGQEEPYVSLFYSEGTGANLRTALRELNGIIDETADHISARSGEISGDINGILDNLERVRIGTDEYLDEADRIINANVDSLNELSSRAADITEMAKPVSEDLTTAADELQGAFADLSEGAEHLAKAGDAVDDGMDYIGDGLKQLSEAAGYLANSSEALGNGIDALEHSLGDSAQMGRSLEELRGDMRTLRTNVTDAAAAVSKLLEAFSDYNSSSYTQVMRMNIEGELRHLGGALGRASGDIERCEAAFSQIEELMRNENYDINSYNPYIEEILSNLSDGALSEAFSSLSLLSGYVSELFSNEAYGRLSEQARQSIYGISGSMKGASGAGREINEDIDRMDGQVNGKYLRDFWENFKSSARQAGESFDPLKSAIDYIYDSGEFLREADRALISAAVCAESAADRAQAAFTHTADAFEQTGNIIEYLAEKEKIAFTGVSDDIIAAGDRLSALLGELSELCGELTDSGSGAARGISGDIKRLNDKAGEVSDLIFELFDEVSGKSADPADYTEDISSEDTAGRSDGKIASCVNYGDIRGDLNVGGIAGAMAVEVGFDPEGDIETVGERSLDFMYMSKAVVRECKSFGRVTSKKDCAGGIVGEMDTGCVMNCGGYGDVSSEDGSYAGGIAGKSAAKIYGCYAMCRVGASKNAGGIAGLGHDLENCRSFVIIKNANECAGFIAGYADGELSGCSFIQGAREPVTESLEEDEGGIAVFGGVDNISYGGRAYPLSYEEMMRGNDIPSEFGQISFIFAKGDKVIGTVTVPYGGDISREECPEPLAEEGKFVRWQEFEGKNVTFGARIEAVYSDYITALGGEETRENGLTAVICQGKFGEGDVLTVESIGDEGRRVVIPPSADGNEQGEHTVRFLPVGDPDRTEIILRDDLGERQIETLRDGQYLVFGVSGNVFEFYSLQRSVDTSFYLWAGIACAGAVCVGLIWGRKRKIRKNKTGKKREKIKI